MWTIMLTATAFAAAMPGQDYDDCLATIGRALEASGEDAGNVASATVSACNSVNPVTSAPAVGSPMSSDEWIDSIALSRELSRDEVLLMVVRIRACRRSLNCRVDAIALAPR